MRSDERQSLRLAIYHARRGLTQALPLSKECRAGGIALELTTADLADDEMMMLRQEEES